MDARILRVGTIIVHNTTNKRAKITDASDNPYVISLSYSYVESGNTRSIIDTDLENFIEKWDVLDTKSKEIEPIPV